MKILLFISFVRMICKTFEIFLFSIIESSKSSLSYLKLMKIKILLNDFLISYWFLISTWTSYLFMNSLRKTTCEIWLPSSWLWISIFILLNVHMLFSNFATIWKEQFVRLKTKFRFFVFVFSLIFWSLIQQKYIVIFTFFLLCLKFLMITTYFSSLINSLTICTNSKTFAYWSFKENNVMISFVDSNSLTK